MLDTGSGWNLNRSLEMTEVVALDPLPGYGDLMTWETWFRRTECRAFIDYDGFGYFATERSYDCRKEVYPSQAKTTEKPDWATHILWLNR